MKFTQQTKLAHAIELAQRGLFVLPIKPEEKTPLTAWKNGEPGQEATIDLDIIRQWWTKWPTANIAISTEPSGLLVVDVDVKNGKEGASAYIILDVALADVPWPQTLKAHTPSGGWHDYFQVDIPVSGTTDFLKDQIGTGIDIKSAGGYVLAPGSKLPGGLYEWHDANVPIAPAPPELLELLTSMHYPAPTPVEPGRFNPDQLAEMLRHLDPSDFQNHDKWFQLMCACHHATGGEGCEEFVDWSTDDPMYSGDGEGIRKKWGTLGNKTEQGAIVTERTLMWYVRKAGGTIPGESPEDDFDALPELAHDLLSSNTDEKPGESGETLTEIVARLAQLPLLEYDQQRKAEAEALGVTLMNLDKSVAQERAKNGVGQDAQGAEIVFPDILPADAPVDGSALLTTLTNVLNRYLVLPTGAPEAIVLWVVRSFAHDVFEINPRLAARSPEKQCGKTTLLEFLTMIVPRPLLSSNCTPASIFRIIEKCQPTLLVDEMDSFQDSHEELRGILNSGHTRSAARVIRTVGEDHEPRAFSTWCPMVLAAIGKLPDTLEDRSLRINLQRKKKSDKVQRFPRKGPALKALQDELAILQGQCARWVADHMTLLSVAEPEALPELSDRANDNWYSLLSVAEVIGGEWPQKARMIAVILSGENTDAKTLGVLLLADIQEIFENRGVDRISSGELCASLVLLEERPWATWPKGKPITMNKLAWLLGKFDVTSQTIRFGYNDFAKGYHKENFVEPWERYGVHPSKN